MEQNANAILTLCSHICVGTGVEPLEPAEWSALAGKLMEEKLQPGDLFDCGRQELTGRLGLDEPMAERILRLIGRNASLSFALGEYENMGILALTRADRQYPAKLKKKLGTACPPIFYCAGDPELLNCPAVGYVGSHTVTAGDVRFTADAVGKTFAGGYGVVSDGSGRIGIAAEEAVLALGGTAVSFLTDSMLRKMRKSETLRAVQRGRLLLLASAVPDAVPPAETVLRQNRFIYAQSAGTVVVRAEYGRGITRAGALENLRSRRCPTLCRNEMTCPGNRELIEAGAVPVGDAWNGDPEGLPVSGE